MIDIHTHILNEVDDGARSINETYIMIEKAKGAGFTDIICTPHYIEDYYNLDKLAIKKRLDEIQTNIVLHQGNEIYISEFMTDFLEQNKASSLAGSDYVLFELPMDKNVIYMEDVIYSLFENNYIPIIAHPERYRFVQNNPNFVYDLVEKGVLFQSNYGSIIGQYGQNAQKTLQKLLKAKLIHFLGSDAHREYSAYDNMKKILNELSKFITYDEINQLTTINPMAILENRKIDIPTPERIKSSFLKKFF